MATISAMHRKHSSRLGDDDCCARASHSPCPTGELSVGGISFWWEIGKAEHACGPRFASGDGPTLVLVLFSVWIHLLTGSSVTTGALSALRATGWMGYVIEGRRELLVVLVQLGSPVCGSGASSERCSPVNVKVIVLLKLIKARVFSAAGLRSRSNDDLQIGYLKGKSAISGSTQIRSG